MAKTRIVDRKELIKLRKRLVKQGKVSQKAFAEKAGLPVRTLRAYERGERLLTVDKFQEIKENLGYYSDSSNSLRVMIDYLRVTFKNVTDLDFFCQTYLHCPLSEFSSSETGLMSYTHLWRRGDIWIFDFADKTQTGNYQITVQLSGAGCRQFELIMERDGMTWIEVLQRMYFERKDMQVTRIDIALDEMYKGFDKEDEHYDLSSLIVKLKRKEVVYDRIRRWNFIGGGSMPTDEESLEESDQGLSIYFGSRQSNCYFNFYEKRYELAKKEKCSVEESLATFDIWNRFEIRLSKAYANSWMGDFVSGVPLEELSKGIINKYLDVYDGVDEGGFLIPDKKWQSLFGGVEPLVLSTEPEPYSLERTIKWLVYQVSNSLKLVEEADRKMNSEYLRLIMEAGELTDEGEKILSQLSPEDNRYIEESLGVNIG